MSPTCISTLFEQPAIKYKLRNHDLTKPRFNTVSFFGKHSLKYVDPRVWSSVPGNVKEASTLWNITSENWILVEGLNGVNR